MYWNTMHFHWHKNNPDGKITKNYTTFNDSPELFPVPQVFAFLLIIHKATLHIGSDFNITLKIRTLMI